MEQLLFVCAGPQPDVPYNSSMQLLDVLLDNLVQNDTMLHLPCTCTLGFGRQVAFVCAGPRLDVPQKCTEQLKCLQWVAATW